MDTGKVKEIVDKWVIPTPGGAYMAGLENRPVLASASASTVVDTIGREYLDFQSGQMGAALGHRHPRVMKAIEHATRTIVHASNTMLNVPRLQLHERLGGLLTPPLQKSLFLVSGSDSIEASVDLARNATGGYDVLGLHEGLHGSTSLVARSLSFGWDRNKHAALAPGTSAILAPDCYRCPVAATFPDCEVGAIPPFGNLYGVDVYVDQSLADDETIVVRAGTHTDTLSLRYADFARLVEPSVGQLLGGRGMALSRLSG